MKLRDVTRTYGGAVTHVWPPQLLVQIGSLIVQPGEGGPKCVTRFGNRLSLTVEHEGQEAWGGVEVEQDSDRQWTRSRGCSRPALGRRLRRSATSTLVESPSAPERSVSLT